MVADKIIVQIDCVRLQGYPVNGLTNCQVTYSYVRHGKRSTNAYWCWAKDELDALVITTRTAKANGWVVGELSPDHEEN